MFSDIGDVSSIQRDGRPPTVATAGAAVVHPARAPDDAEASPREGGGDVRLEANVTSCEGRDFSRFRDFSRPCAEENFPPCPATCFRNMRRIPAADDGRAVVRDQRRGAVGGGEIKAASKTFLQAFPNPGCFCPSFSKQSFGQYVGFQWVTRVKNQKVPPSKFFVLSASFQPHSRRRRACFRRRATHGVPRAHPAVGGVCGA
jgi:hypothetical protein